MPKHVVVDANLLLLLVVGSAGRDLVSAHKRLGRYTGRDFDRLAAIIDHFDGVVLLPHVLTEVSNLARQISGPAKRMIGRSLGNLVAAWPERYVPSLVGVQRAEFFALGLTDAVLLSLLGLEHEGWEPTLITADEALFDHALAGGCSVIDYAQLP